MWCNEADVGRSQTLLEGRYNVCVVVVTLEAILLVISAVSVTFYTSLLLFI
jgi:hypothetical protein